MGGLLLCGYRFVCPHVLLNLFCGLSCFASEDFVSMDSGDKTKTWNFYISDTNIIVERSDCGTVTLYESITEPQMRYVMLVLLGNNPY